jgi:hypothetical protein
MGGMGSGMTPESEGFIEVFCDGAHGGRQVGGTTIASPNGLFVVAE